MSKTKAKRRSIRNKILVMLVGTALLSLVPFSQVAFRGLFSIRAQMQQSSAQLGEFAAKNSSVFLEREAIDKLMTRAKDQSLFINERLQSIAKDAVYFAGHVAEIYKNANRLTPVYVPYPSSENHGKLTMQLVSVNGKSDYPRIKKEAGLLGNVTSAFVSNASDMEAITVAVYLATESGFAIVYDPFSSDGNRAFDPRGRIWYASAKERGGTFWTEPYFDAASGKLIVTCSNPFYGANGEFRGVAGIDVVIDDLNNEIINIDMGENGYAFVVSASGTVISSKELERRGDGVYEKKSAFMENNREYNDVIKKMTNGETGFAKVNTDSGEKYMAYAAIPVTGWSVAIARPVSDIMGLVAENSDAIEKMTLKTLGSVNSAIKETFIVFAVMFVVVALTVLYLARMFTAKISKPIIVLEKGLRRIAGGELDTEINIKTGDEIERLGYSVNAMARELKEY
ncbi:MAG: Cache 3/Cache 2 fusion domain-containing protein, partial [Chitinispirillales bacterium]|nr:Cache 3/Cache 2 fusion domain-containing protein [Chitinispirillales bacterium]